MQEVQGSGKFVRWWLIIINNILSDIGFAINCNENWKSLYCVNYCTQTAENDAVTQLQAEDKLQSINEAKRQL